MWAVIRSLPLQRTTLHIASAVSDCWQNCDRAGRVAAWLMTSICCPPVVLCVLCLCVRRSARIQEQAAEV